MLGLAVRDAVAHEHWDTIEFHTVNFHSGIAQVMDITVKPVNGGTAKTVIVVAANEYLLRTRKVAEPVHEIQRFLLYQLIMLLPFFAILLFNFISIYHTCILMSIYFRTFVCFFTNKTSLILKTILALKYFLKTIGFKKPH